MLSKGIQRDVEKKKHEKQDNYLKGYVCTVRILIEYARNF